MDGAPGLSYAGNADASFLLGAGRARPTNNFFYACRKVQFAFRRQPRSGERVQPTAQAVGQPR